VPSDPSHGYLIHIRDNIRLAQGFVEAISYAEFHADTRTVYAVIRCLEIISEASRRVAQEVKSRHPELPWSDMASAGNIHRTIMKMRVRRWSGRQSRMPCPAC
jgi:uncharacterized protein with HEPN domain